MSGSRNEPIAVSHTSSKTEADAVKTFYRLGTTAEFSVKSTAALFYGALIINETGVTIYVHLFNQATAPVLDEVPAIVLARLATNQALTIGCAIQAQGVLLSTGIAIGLSSTRATYTPIVDMNHVLTVWYE